MLQNAYLQPNCNRWMDSDQACKDTAFGGALLFYLDINLNYKSVVELPNLADNIHQDARLISDISSKDKQIWLWGHSFPLETLF